MDSITQVTLGAALGEAVLGRKVGMKAVAWGALLGTVPDLDVLANPFLDSVSELRFHRGITHSVLFSVITAPVFGWIINKIHPAVKIGVRGWAKLAFIVLFTHPLLDILTTYGTQFLTPFTDWPLTTDSIFIIDPVYTVPLSIGLITALFLKRSSRARTIANTTGLILSTLYLVWGLGIKAHVHSVFDASFTHQYGYYDKIKTTPNGPSTFLWVGYVIHEDTVYQSVYSIFDESTDLEFRKIPRNTELIEPYMNHRALDALLWFSRDYYRIEREGDRLFFYDLRFGRSDLWLTDSEDAELVWRNRVLFNEEGVAYAFEQSTPAFDARSSIFSRFIDRIKGE